MVKCRESARRFKSLQFIPRQEYLTPENVEFLIDEGDIVFVGVDNFATRKVISDRAVQLRDVLVISGGNEYTDGNVRFHLRVRGKDITLPLANSFHPEVMSPRDKNPAELGCGEMVESQPQLVLMNNLVASHMLAGFYAYLEGKLDYDEVYLDLLTGQARPVRRSAKC